MKIAYFNVVYEQDEDGYYVATVPSLPGCYTQGKTLEEAKKRIGEVVKMCLDEAEDIETATVPRFVGIDSISVSLPHA